MEERKMKLWRNPGSLMRNFQKGAQRNGRRVRSASEVSSRGEVWKSGQNVRKHCRIRILGGARQGKHWRLLVKGKDS